MILLKAEQGVSLPGSLTQELSEILQHLFILLIMVCVARSTLILPEKCQVLISPALRSDGNCSHSVHPK